MRRRAPRARARAPNVHVQTEERARTYTRAWIRRDLATRVHVRVYLALAAAAASAGAFEGARAAAVSGAF
jgi:hypothetical protein